MEDNKSLVDDDELNQMVADLKSKQTGIPKLTSDSGAPESPAVQTPIVSNPPSPVSPVPSGAVAQPAPLPTPVFTSNLEPILPNDAVMAPPLPIPAPANSNLDSIKQDALLELRPLVEKLNLSPNDKFDTLLLLIRSTDDSSLLPAAHAAAKQIPDETRRAQALLDVIKEIDFFKQR